MASVTYTFGDILTGAIIADIPMYGVSMARAFGSGELRGSFQLDQTGQTNDALVSATIPGRCFVACERDGVVLWSGIVWSRTYQSQAKVMQLYCRGYEHYLDKRLIRTDTEFVNVEQMNIFRSLLTQMMVDPNSIQFSLPDAFPDTNLKSLSIKASEFKTYRSAVDELADGEDGFDWYIEPQRQGDVYIKSVRCGYPVLGIQNPDAAVTFDYPGNITNYWKNASMANTGTNIFGVGSGEGSTMLTVEVEHEDLLAANHPRYDLDISLKSVNDITRLTSLTLRQAMIRKAPGTIFTVETKGDKEPQAGSYGLGDLARLYMDDPLHYNPSLGYFAARIIGWEYVPASNDSVEMTRIVFEGDDLQ